MAEGGVVWSSSPSLIRITSRGMKRRDSFTVPNFKCSFELATYSGSFSAPTPPVQEGKRLHEL